MSLEEHALELLGAIIEEFDLQKLAEQIKVATQLFFSRMFEYKQKTKSKVIPRAFVKGALIFFARVVAKFGVDALFDLTDQVQGGILNNFFEKEGEKLSVMEKSDPY